MTFVGVYFVVFNPLLLSVGVPSWATGLLLAMVTLVSVLAFGLYLDRIRFWEAQSLIATTRNPFLISALYQKEAMSMRYNHIPQLKTFKLLVESLPTGTERDEILNELAAAIAKIEEALANKQWTISDDEQVY